MQPKRIHGRLENIDTVKQLSKIAFVVLTLYCTAPGLLIEWYVHYNPSVEWYVHCNPSFEWYIHCNPSFKWYIYCTARHLRGNPVSPIAHMYVTLEFHATVRMHIHL